MKKRTPTSLGSDKSQESPIKRDKKLVTFQYHQLDCFLSAFSLKTKKSGPTQPKQTSRKEMEKIETAKEKMDLKNAFSQLSIPRRNRGKTTSSSQNVFNNSILLLEYENRDEGRMDSVHKSKQHRESPKSNEEDQMVKAIINSCLEVIRQDTQSSSNHISSQYTPRSVTQASLSQIHSYDPMMPHIHEGYYYPKKSGRNRRVISSQEANAFCIDIDNIQTDGRTTIMVRNIPNKYTQQMLIKRFEVNHKKKFDFFYLPIDYNNNCNVGYAFINFIHSKFILDFYNEFHNHKWEKFNSVKVCQICYGRIQGTAQLQHHFEHSNVMQQKEKRFRPLIGLKSLSGNIQTLVKKQRQGKTSLKKKQSTN